MSPSHKAEESASRRYLPAEERRDETARVVVDLAADQNPNGISTKAIAEKMGVTQGAIFRHFPNKEAIFAGVVQWVARRLMKRIDAAIRDIDSPIGKLEAMFHAHVGFVSEHPGVPRMIFGELQNPGDRLPKRLVRELVGRYGEKIAGLLEAGQERGEIDPGLDLEAAASLFIGTIQGLVMQSLIAGDSDLVRDRAPGAFEIYRRGIALSA
ncbi:TetR/AcrR family transcriptional regulator [Guyparkeria sp. 1SP6A2]|nr:TetR/AcrR family transcriptional regulator [Guyparkeria sp. 1SP6A2]